MQSSWLHVLRSAEVREYKHKHTGSDMELLPQHCPWNPLCVVFMLAEKGCISS